MAEPLKCQCGHYSGQHSYSMACTVCSGSPNACPCKGFEPAETNIGLQLLIVDFGDSCAVKVEQGLPWNLYWGGETNVFDEGQDAHLFNDTTFGVLRHHIDAMDEEKRPATYLERVNDQIVLSSSKAYANGVGGVLSLRQDEYDALSELAGHRLPIYEPRGKGEWVHLYGDTKDLYDLPIQVWRYTRMK